MSLYSDEIKGRVIQLRKSGLSLRQIHMQLNIPKTTLHSWVQGIVISRQLQENIKVEALEALQRGRVVFQTLRKQKRKEQEEVSMQSGIRSVGKLTRKELFIAGIALYWAEGFKNKHEHRLGFCNSDPAMIKFYINWLEKCINVKRQDLVLRVTLNSVYKAKIRDVELYWSDYTKIPLSQFTKPFYQNAKWKKQYNQGDYHGVLRVHVKNSLDSLFEVKGFIEGLKNNLPR